MTDREAFHLRDKINESTKKLAEKAGLSLEDYEKNIFYPKFDDLNSEEFYPVQLPNQIKMFKTELNDEAVWNSLVSSASFTQVLEKFIFRKKQERAEKVKTLLEEVYLGLLSETEIDNWINFGALGCE